MKFKILIFAQTAWGYLKQMSFREERNRQKKSCNRKPMPSTVVSRYLLLPRQQAEFLEYGFDYGMNSMFNRVIWRMALFL
jgi:hypothetical protein